MKDGAVLMIRSQLLGLRHGQINDDSVDVEIGVYNWAESKLLQRDPWTKKSRVSRCDNVARFAADAEKCQFVVVLCTLGYNSRSRQGISPDELPYFQRESSEETERGCLGRWWYNRLSEFWDEVSLDLLNMV